MQFDTTYLNRTDNKTLRSRYADSQPRFVVWHETASPRPDDPYLTLNFNLKNDGMRGSYHVLIARNGKAFLYLDARTYIAWHAGKRNRREDASYTLNGRTYRGFELNAWSFGVELDGACDGTPITPAQSKTAVQLMLWLWDTFDIPLERQYHIMHKEVTASNYRTDPACTSVDELLLAAQAARQSKREKPEPGTYIIDVDVANVREGPGTAFRVALGGDAKLQRDTWVEIDTVISGETINNNLWWGHLKSAIGFVWMGLVRPLPKPRIVPQPLALNSLLMELPHATLPQCQHFLVQKPHGTYDDDDVRWIARLYFEIAQPVGLDPLVAMAQMVHETDSLASFWSQPPRRNPAGIGVTGQPDVGLSFPNWNAAVRAHVGRLLAYALPEGDETPAQQALIAEALNWRPLPASKRGIAPTLRGLSGTWAADQRYAEKIAERSKAIIG